MKKIKSLKIAKIFGIDIEIDSSWFIIFTLFTWMLASSILPGMVPRQSPIYYWLFGIATSLVLFVSVLVHELAHSLVAKRFKMSISRIVLFILGGVADLKEESKSPKIEFLMALAGPLSSIVLAGIFFALAIFLKTEFKLISASLSYLALINVFLAIFNLLPGYPMDGGRILKAFLWAVFKDELKATKIASGSGQFFGFLMIFLGILSVLRGNFGGLWLAFIGWFLLTMAKRGYQQLVAKKTEEVMSKIKAKEVMEVIPEAFKPVDIERVAICSPEDTLFAVALRMWASGGTAVFVVENNEAIGIITSGGIEAYLKSKL